MTAIALTPASEALAGRHLRYREQGSSQTLADGLEEYYAANTGRVLLPALLSPESRELFRSHDMCHVIFGLDTTMEDEAMADTRTMLSCDVGWKRYALYLTSNKDAMAIFKSVGYGRVLWVSLLTVPRLTRAVAESFRVRRKWPWHPPTEYMDMSISELRRLHGIRVI